MIIASETVPAAAVLSHIEQLAKDYAEARTVVSERVDSYEMEVRAAQRRRLPGIRSAVAAAANAQAKLTAAVQERPDLFAKPRTLTLHGIRFGFAKGRGKTEWPDDAKLIAALRKTFAPATVAGLVESVETPVKAAIERLPAHELKKLGVVIHSTGDHVFVKASDSAVDKLVEKLLSEGAIEEAATGGAK